MSDHSDRRSERDRRPPTKLADYTTGEGLSTIQPKATSTPARETKETDRMSSVSSASSATVVGRKKLEAELKAAEEQAALQQQLQDRKLQLEERKLQRELELSKIRLKVENAKIDEEAEAFDNVAGSSKILAQETSRAEDIENWVHSQGKLNPDHNRPSPPNDEPLRRTKVTKNEPQSPPSSKSSRSTRDYDSSSDKSKKSTKPNLEEILSKAMDVLGRQAELIGQNGKSTSHSSTESARSTIGRELTPFSGLPEEWPSFISEYNECTELCGFSDRENLQRLKKSLKGKAEEVVQSLMTVPENVTKIIETLQLRFGRPDFIIETLIEKARKLPSMKEDKFDTIIDFATAVQNLSTTTESLKCPNYLTNPQLLKDLTSKLSAAWKTKWCSYIAKKNIYLPSVTDFSTWIGTKATELACLSTPVVESTTEKKEKGQKKVFATTEVQEPKKSTESRRCLYCQKNNHDIGFCREFKRIELDLRWNFVKEKKTCYCCFQLGHQTSNCKKRKSCGLDGCELLHHRLLHYKKKEKPPETESRTEVKTTSDPSSVFTTITGPGNRIMYKIVPVILKGTKKSLNTYALLDEASAYTLIEQSFAEEIGINGPKSPLSIRGAREIVSVDADSRIVNLKISGVKDKKTYEMKNVRRVSNLGMPNQSVDIKNIPRIEEMQR